MNRLLAQLGLVAPGGPLKDKNFREAVTVLEPSSAKSIKIVYFWLLRQFLSDFA